MRYRVLPYRQGSKGAKALATALGGKVLKLTGSSFIGGQTDVVINWGNTDYIHPNILIGPVFNGMDLRDATNKRNFLQRMRDAGHASIIPPFWTNSYDIPDEAFPIVCRQSLAGHSGEGIHIANTRDELVTAPLYVGYIKKKDEYRVHIGKRLASGGIDVVSSSEYDTIAVQRKARRTDVPDAEVNWKVRNHGNGFVFVRGGVNPAPSVIEAARLALECSGLDFGAVDVIWNAQTERPYVLEINTAPGLEGQTVQDYADFFKGIGYAF